jgi:CarD family transcriptional regulator
MVTAAFAATAKKIAPQNMGLFRKGDSIVFPAHGVGKVDRVGLEEIAGHKLNMIHISFEENQMTLRVPVAQARSIGLRRPANKKQLADALLRLEERPKPSRLMWAKRAQEYLAKINSGELAALAEAVRDLQTAGDGSGSSFSQRNLFELALDRLAAECAVINRTAKSDAVMQLRRALVEAQTKIKQTKG